MYNPYQGMSGLITTQFWGTNENDRSIRSIWCCSEWRYVQSLVPHRNVLTSSTAPPGMAAPGTGAPPGMQQQDAHQQGRPGPFPPHFQPPANLPNINFAAPVIRLGAGPKPDVPAGRDDRDRGGRRAGLGMGSDLRGERERPQPIQPQTKEEIIKTLFIGGITEGAGGDEGIERILRAAGDLRRWFRATDADDKPCKFGFAEYEDPESLATAIEVLKDVEIPVTQRSPDSVSKNEHAVEKSRLLVSPKSRMRSLPTNFCQVVADENSYAYIEQYEESQGGVDSNHKQMLIDQARDALRAVLADLENPQSRPRDNMSGIDKDGDTDMGEAQRADGDVVTIPLTVDDELSDIPAEMRETVAKEIAAFRDRSNRRDLERLKREEEIEQQEKDRMMNGNRSRLSSPPPSAPSGPGGANSVPSGPRGGAPSGPKSLGTGFAKDYQKGVIFVNGTGVSAASAFEDEDTDASDEELEKRRQGKKNADNEKHYLDQERRWLNRERSRTAAIEREKNRDQEEESRRDAEKEAMAKRLREWNDDVEASRKLDPYYADHSLWIRSRAAFRQREAADDDADRAAEQRERARDNSQKERAGLMTDDFLSRSSDILQPSSDSAGAATLDPGRREPAKFKMSLGAAAQKQAQASQAAQHNAKRPMTDVEGLLEDEEDAEAGQTRRQLVPIPASQLESAKVVQNDMTDEERAQAAQTLAAEIPNDKSALWAWRVHWDYLETDTIEDRLKPFVEKKIVEYLGVQEQMLVDVVVTALREKKGPEELVKELEGALDEEEAEVLVRKLWRMVVFFSESGRRGLGA